MGIVRTIFARYKLLLFCNSLAFCLGVLFFISHYPFVDFSALEQYDPGKPSILLDNNGNEWGRFQIDKRKPISLQEMPDHLLHAFISAEDWKFYSHCGLSFRGIFRSFIMNLYYGRIVQGASTITQQLVKLLYFTNKRSFRRKIKEQFLTLLVERQFTKEQILETYLNHVYFGCGIYGVEAAAQRFWNKRAKDLSIDESAVLAGTVCSPGNYCPLLYPLSSEHRRNIILKKIYYLNFISEEEYKKNKNKSLVTSVKKEFHSAFHLKETLRLFLEKEFGKNALYTEGFTIQTTLDKTMQVHAERAFKKQFLHLRKKLFGDVEGALMTIDRSNGEIRALVGGFDFFGSQFNRALQAKRQQGSVFKPVVFAAALEKGIHLLDTAIDEPLHVKAGKSVWKPRNHTRYFEGKMTLARALSYSNNIISAKALLEIGVNPIIDCARRCHLIGTINPYPALSLGCLDSTLSEVVGMFNVFANEGIYVEPHALKWVKDKWGKKIYRTSYKKDRAISFKVASQIGKTLMAGLERKRKTNKDWIDSVAMSKTGTTNDSRTCWFAGSTPELTTVVYVGCDDNRPLGQDIYPIYTAYPIWLNLHKKIPTVKKQFSFDPSLKEVLVDWKTGKIVQSESGNDIHPLLI